MMEVGRIVVGDGGKSTKSSRIDPRPAWRPVAWFSLLFVFASSVDMVISVLPANLEDPVVRFGTVVGLAGGLPLLTIGLVGFLIAAMGSESRGLVAAAVAGNTAVFILVVGLLILVVFAFGPASASAPAEGHAALSQSLTRGITFAVCFGVVMVFSAVTGWRSLRGTAET